MNSTPSNMFTPALAKAAIHPGKSTVTTRLSTVTRYYVPEGNMTRDQVLDLALACAVSTTGNSNNLQQWKNLIATFTNILFEGIVTKLPKALFQATRLDAAAMQSLRASFAQLDADTDAVPADNLEGLGPGAFANYTVPWDLPAPSSDASGGWGTYCRQEKSLYAHYALIVFLAGKQITASNRSPITVARPKALIGKFKIEAPEILNGSLRISDTGHEMIFQAWLEMSALKAECFREFSTYSDASTTLGQDIVLTNVTLMRFSQMTHAVLIHKFLLAYPWATELPALRQSIALFRDSLQSAAKIEPHLQPFVKVIWGDKSGLFPRKDLGPLIAVALDTEKDVHDTLSDYYSDERFASIVEAFRDERDRREGNKAVPLASTAPVHADSENEEEDDGTRDDVMEEEIV